MAAPAIPALARANRAFTVDAVEKMAAAGIAQFLDIGSGLPTSPSVHEVTSELAPDARLVYVDIDRCRSGCSPVRTGALVRAAISGVVSGGIP